MNGKELSEHLNKLKKEDPKEFRRVLSKITYTQHRWV